MSDFEVRALVDADVPDVLSALEAAFDRTFTEDWFLWKHRENPAGHSYGLVAEDEAGFLGVRLLLQWRFSSNGTPISGLRPCDTVTVGRARRRGVFKTMTTRAIEEVRADHDLLFNTPNEQSLPGYLKMGFAVWHSVDQGVRLVRPSVARLGDATTSPLSGSSRDMCTVKDDAFMAWRYSSRSGLEYRAVSLADSNDASGMVYRLRQWRGRRMIVVSEAWGSPKERSQLLAAVAAKEKTLLCWNRAGATTLPPRAQTTVTTLPLRMRDQPPHPEFSVGDVEDVL